MDEDTRQQFAEIRAILAQTAQQQSLAADRLDRIDEQQARNTEAISQLTHITEELGQYIREQFRLTSDVRGELAQHASDPDAHQAG